MQEGTFTNHRPIHHYFIDGNAVQKILGLLQASTGTLKTIQISTKERRLILDTLLQFYQLHFPELGKIKSLDILRTLM